MAARYLKAENMDLFVSATLLFEKASREKALEVKEDRALYEAKPARKKLG
jgi:hypothetical protein